MRASGLLAPLHLRERDLAFCGEGGGGGRAGAAVRYRTAPAPSEAFDATGSVDIDPRSGDGRRRGSGAKERRGGRVREGERWTGKKAREEERARVVGEKGKGRKEGEC